MARKKQVTRIDLKKNIVLYYLAIGIILLGYVLLSMGDANSLTSLTLGPIVIVLGYLVAVPIALLAGASRPKSGESKAPSDPPKKVMKS